MVAELEYTPFLIIGLALFLGFFVHSIVGFAAALVAMPLLLQLLTIQESVGILSVFILIFSGLTTYREWQHIDRNVTYRLAWGMLPGVIFGSWILSHVETEIMKRLLGGFILLFILSTYIRNKKLSSVANLGIPVGFLGGVFSVLFSAAGPPFAIYVCSSVESTRAIRATLVGILFLNSIVRIPALMVSGVFTAEIWRWCLLLSPFFALALWVGAGVRKSLNNEGFKHFLMVVLLLSALALIFR
jgi:uncharacterized membrane protein YfcA